MESLIAKLPCYDMPITHIYIFPFLATASELLKNTISHYFNTGRISFSIHRIDIGIDYFTNLSTFLKFFLAQHRFYKTTV